MYIRQIGSNFKRAGDGSVSQWRYYVEVRSMVWRSDDGVKNE